MRAPCDVSAAIDARVAQELVHRVHRARVLREGEHLLAAMPRADLANGLCARCVDVRALARAHFREERTNRVEMRTHEREQRVRLRRRRGDQLRECKLDRVICAAPRAKLAAVGIAPLLERAFQRDAARNPASQRAGECAPARGPLPEQAPGEQRAASTAVRWRDRRGERQHGAQERRVVAYRYPDRRRRIREWNRRRDITALAAHDHRCQLRVTQRVGACAEEEREERRELGAAIVHRRRSDEQQLRAGRHRCEHCVAQRGRGARVMRLVEHEEIEVTLGHRAARQRAVRDHRRAHAGGSQRIAPHGPQRGGQHEQRSRGIAHHRRRDVRLAQSGLVREESAAMLAHEHAEPIDRALLMRVERDRAKRVVRFACGEPVRGDQGTRLRRAHDHRAAQPMSGATSAARSR